MTADGGYRAFMHAAVERFSAVPCERMEVKSVDGLKLVGRFYRAENADKTVICVHGYCGTGLRDMSAIAPFFLQNGFNVLLVDNRAHGESEGNIIGYGVLDSLDVTVWINALKTAHPVKSTFLYGISMGAATAMMTAQYVRRDEIAGIIADCGFTSIYEEFCYLYRTVAHVPPCIIVPAIRRRAKKFAGYDIKTTDAREILARTDIPVMFIHGSGNLYQQEETAVHSMVDFFLLIQLAGTGDELQGIKRGIMEMADGIIINKADGDNLEKAKLAAAQFRNALHLFPAPESGWSPKVLTYSGYYNLGIKEIWDMVGEYMEFTQKNGYFNYKRNEQAKYWMYESINDTLRETFYHNPAVEKMLNFTEQQVLNNEISSFVAAKRMMDLFLENLSAKK